MKITVDKKKCIGCGSCASICPDCFKMKDSKSEVIKKNVDKVSAELKDAVESCPVQCIKIEK